MLVLQVCLLFVALTLCALCHAAPTLIRKQRGFQTSVVKSGASLVTPLILKGLQGALGMSKGSFEAYRIAAQKETTEGKWLTSKFVNLLFVPKLSLLTNQIRDLDLKIQNQNKQKAVIISLAAVVPTIMLTLILLCLINGRRTKCVKGKLQETNRSLELL